MRCLTTDQVNTIEQGGHSVHSHQVQASLLTLDSGSGFNQLEHVVTQDG